ncbi:succinate dehydrogenase [ubiquinone] cytochrome b small subunit, mitochondrial-like [Planococcus citri]|uniref:succinate dehydrogenase [ubiquinone] cytochrome b small subunit, mitochondrial-like n=1 Tax=Planococcus citri TaxID=170843 RepID=UPI0031F9B361
MMNSLTICSRAFKPSITAINCGKIALNRSVYILSSRPRVSYCNFANNVSKCRLGYLKSFTLNQITANGKRLVSNNSASPVPSYKNKDHANVWLWERFVAVGLLGVIPFLADKSSPKAVEYIAVTLLTVHLHWGLEAICTDYLRPSVVGTVIPKCIPVIVLAPLGFLLYGLVNSIQSDRGITHVLRQFWYLKTTEQLKIEQSQ